MERPKIELANYFIMHFNIFSIFRLCKKFEANWTPMHSNKNGPHVAQEAGWT